LPSPHTVGRNLAATKRAISQQGDYVRRPCAWPRVALCRMSHIGQGLSSSTGANRLNPCPLYLRFQACQWCSGRITLCAINSCEHEQQGAHKSSPYGVLECVFSRRASSAASANIQSRKVVIFGTDAVVVGQTIQ